MTNRIRLAGPSTLGLPLIAGQWIELGVASGRLRLCAAGRPTEHATVTAGLAILRLGPFEGFANFTLHLEAGEYAIDGPAADLLKGD